MCAARACTHMTTLLYSSVASRPVKSFLHRFTNPCTRMSSAVEHVVLFKVRPGTDPSKVDAMVNGLNGLHSLCQVTHLTAGPLLRSRSSSLSFTHLLHSRYKSKSDLSDYALHPSHVSVVSEFVRPIVDDIMAVDWVADGLSDAVHPKPGSAMRVSFLKLRENLEDKQRSAILEVVGEMKTKFPSILQFSFGENFSPGRSKGFSVASIAVYEGSDELEAMDSESNSEIVKSLKHKVEDLLDDFLFVDYIVPLPQSTASTCL